MLEAVVFLAWLGVFSLLLCAKKKKERPAPVQIVIPIYHEPYNPKFIKSQRGNVSEYEKLASALEIPMEVEKDSKRDKKVKSDPGPQSPVAEPTAADEKSKVAPTQMEIIPAAKDGESPGSEDKKSPVVAGGGAAAEEPFTTPNVPPPEAKETSVKSDVGTQHLKKAPETQQDYYDLDILQRLGDDVKKEAGLDKKSKSERKSSKKSLQKSLKKGAFDFGGVPAS